MNEPKKTDFFPAGDEQLAELTASYQDTEEDLRHEEDLMKLEAIIFENSDTALETELGELRYNQEADRKRWNELEQEFDRAFDEAKRLDL